MADRNLLDEVTKENGDGKDAATPLPPIPKTADLEKAKRLAKAAAKKIAGELHPDLRARLSGQSRTSDLAFTQAHLMLLNKHKALAERANLPPVLVEGVIQSEGLSASLTEAAAPVGEVVWGWFGQVRKRLLDFNQRIAPYRDGEKPVIGRDPGDVVDAFAPAREIQRQQAAKKIARTARLKRQREEAAQAVDKQKRVIKERKSVERLKDRAKKGTLGPQARRLDYQGGTDEE
jgi:hypothetical protein